jgi:hypothetical protein
MSDEKKTRLTWARVSGDTSGQTRVGLAGGVTLFRYTWDASKVHPGQPYVMTSELPGHTGRRWRGATPEELPPVAERVLAIWLEAIGVTARASS